jgi:hypothetical protein
MKLLPLRSLFERLEEQRVKKQLEWEEEHKVSAGFLRQKRWKKMQPFTLQKMEPSSLFFV